MGVIDWKNLSLPQAREFADAWHQTRPDAIEWLARQIQRPLTSPGADELRAAWAWYRSWRQTEHPDTRPPLWWRDNDTPGTINRAYRVDEARAIDALAHLLVAALFTVEPGLTWTIPNRGRRKVRQISENHPCLTPSEPDGRRFNPIGVADTLGLLLVQGCTDVRVGPDALIRFYDPYVDYLKEEARGASKEAVKPTAPHAREAFEVTETEDDEWTHLVGFSDEVAHEHEEAIEKALDMLRRLPVVQDASHLDREEIGVRAPGVEAAALAEALRIHLDSELRP